MRILLTLLSAASLAAAHFGSTPRSERADAAQALLESLDETSRDRAVHDFADNERERWNFLPGDYPGARLGDLDDASLGALDRLLDGHLSKRGRAEVEGIRDLERVLFELESRPGRPATHRDPGRYFLAVFGEPGDEAPWGWRLQGHHLSLNFTAAGDGAPAVTPLFRGANPLRREGAPAGEGVLAQEVAAARALVLSLDGDALGRAHVADAVPRDITLPPNHGPSLDEAPGESQGLAVGEMEPEQRALFLALLETFLDDFHDEIAAPLRRRLGGDHLNDARFAWLGSLEEGEEFGFRVLAHELTIEATTPRGQPNHLHCVWRDANNDFGAELLRRHLDADHGGKDDDR